MLIKHGALVMVVDGGQMALFRNSAKSDAFTLELIEKREHANPRSSQLGEDKPGRSFQSMGADRSAYEIIDQHQVDEDSFIADAAECLANHMSDSDVGAVLIAPPRALGTMRKCLPDAVRGRLIAEIDKDYTGQSVQELENLLGKYEGMAI